MGLGGGGGTIACRHYQWWPYHMCFGHGSWLRPVEREREKMNKNNFFFFNFTF